MKQDAGPTGDLPDHNGALLRSDQRVPSARPRKPNCEPLAVAPDVAAPALAAQGPERGGHGLRPAARVRQCLAHFAGIKFNCLLANVSDCKLS